MTQLAPFELAYGPLTWIDPHPGVVFAINPADAFFNLRTVIHATSIFAGRNLPRAERVPHMTVAEFITLEATRELLAELDNTVPVGSFLCDHIDYAVPDAYFHFDSALTLSLGDPRERPGPEPNSP